MALLLSLIFFAWFVSAIVRGEFAYKNDTYSFREHPVQFCIILAFILGFALFCLNRFLNEMGVKLF